MNSHLAFVNLFILMLLPICPLGFTVSTEPNNIQRDTIMSTFVNFILTIDDFIEYLRSLPSALRRSVANMITPLSEIVPSNSSIGVVWLQPSWLNKTLTEAYANLEVNSNRSTSNSTLTKLIPPQ